MKPSGIISKALAFCLIITTNALAQSPSWQWAKRCGSVNDNIPSISGNEAFNDIKIDKNGNIYAVGNFFADPVFHNAQLFGAPTPFQFAKDDAYLIKYNSCGVLQWWRRMGGVGNDIPSSLVLDNTGKIIIMLACNGIGNNHFGDGTNNTVIQATLGLQFIAKFDTAGNFIDVKN